LGEYQLHKMYLGWSNFIRLSKNGKRLADDWMYWEDRKSLCDYVLSLCKSKTTLHIVGSNILFDALSSGLIQRLIDDRWHYKFVYDQGLTTIFSLIKGSMRIKIMALQNFVAGGVKSWGRLLGVEKMDVDLENDDVETIKEYCRRDTEITGKMFLQYLSFVKEHDMGGFAVTRASQSLKAFRHRFMNHRILHYDEEQHNRFVRSSYFGGRVECFQLGEIKDGPFCKLDINSMYPYLMKEYEYPTHFRQWTTKPTIAFVQEKLDSSSCIADVTLNTDVPAYGVRFRGKLVFPTGQLRLCLNSGSLSFALLNGQVSQVHSAMFFDKGNLFDSFVSYFYPLKAHYRKEGNKVWESIVKLTLNSLYGKFGELRDNEILNENDDSGDFYREDIYDADTNNKGIECCMFGKRIITCGKVEGPQSMPAIASHITDYARLYLWSLIDTIGLEKVLYCDTDSLFIRKRDISTIESILSQDELGKLKLEDESNYLFIRGCKDYTFGEYTKRKGIRKDAQRIDRFKWKQAQFPNLSTIMRMRVTDGFPIRDIEKSAVPIYDKGNVSGDGQVTPFHLSIDQQPF